MDNTLEKTMIKAICITIILIAICMTISTVALSVKDYHLSIKAMENGYSQQLISNRLIWVKENEEKN